MAVDHSPVAEELREARDLCALPDPEQLELIRDAVPGRDAGTAVAVAERRGRGRPAGALNRRNAKFRDQLLAISGGLHPGLVLARAYSTPVELLAAQLDCTRAEAFGFQLRAAIEAMPYVESKMPVAVAVRQTHDAVLVIADGRTTAGQIDAIRREIEEASDEGVDWATAEIVDVVPSLSGEPMQGVSPEGSA